MNYTNSSLVNYTKISPNKNSPRNHVIDTITIHCYVGQVTAKSGCNSSRFTKYDPNNGASCNYVVGYDGSIGLCVEEKDRSWCSSNKANDHRAVTIEVACTPTPPYIVTDKAMDALIELIADICKRNQIKGLKWQANKNLIGQVNKQNMTVHRWFAAKECPGDYLYNKHYYIAEQVNKKLGINTTPTSPTQSTDNLYRVRKSWSDTASQLGAWKSLANAKKAWKAGYYVFDGNGNIVYPIQSNISSAQTYQVKLLDNLNIRKTPNGTIVQTNGAKKGFVYTIVETQGDWGRLKSGAGWISVSDNYVKRI